MKNLLHLLFTGKDNSSYDIGRILWSMGVLAFLILESIQVYHKLEFDMQAYGIGLGTVLGSGAAALKLKETTEPVKETTEPGGKQ